jgi:hypothetical protein
MIWIKTKRFPPEGYEAVTLWPFVFYKCKKTADVIRHEMYHQRQYLIWWLVGCLVFGIKTWLLGSILNYIFIPLPFVLFYLIWIVGFIFKRYGMKLEQNAGKSEVIKFTQEYKLKK